jgi:hypothetical protein
MPPSSAARMASSFSPAMVGRRPPILSVYQPGLAQSLVENAHRESPDALLPSKFAHKRFYLTGKKLVAHGPNEVQCEA